MIRAVVTDIEGTTSSIHFVHEVLFPYAMEHLQPFVASHESDPAVRQILHDTAAEAGLELADPSDCIRILQQWIREDRKATPLKALQGMIWKQGYEQGDFTGHVYPEVAARLSDWKSRGLKLYVYSSGSVAAQKLLFGYSAAGDLTDFFSGYFDTRIGPKRESQSYERIAEQLALPPSEILFLSDVPAELQAAHEAGYAVCQLRREENTEHQTLYPVATSFDEVVFPD